MPLLVPALGECPIYNTRGGTCDWPEGGEPRISLAHARAETWRKPGGNLAENWRATQGEPGGNLAETWRKPGGNLVRYWWACMHALRYSAVTFRQYLSFFMHVFTLRDTRQTHTGVLGARNLKTGNRLKYARIESMETSTAGASSFHLSHNGM